MRVFIFYLYIYIFALEYGNRKLTVNDHSQANTNETTKKNNAQTHHFQCQQIYRSLHALSIILNCRHARHHGVPMNISIFSIHLSLSLSHPFLWFLYQNFSKANNVKHEH